MRQIKIHVPGVFVDEPEAGDLPTLDDLRRPARFFDVGGLPVSLGKVDGCPIRCAQWVSGRPLIFAESTVHRSGREITERSFRDLIIANKMGY